MRSTARRSAPTILTLASAYEDQQVQAELVIPETFEGVDDAALAALYTEASEAFDALLDSADGDLTPEQLEALASLTEGIEALAAETALRESAKTERLEAAEALATRVRKTLPEEQSVEVEVAQVADEDAELGSEDLASEDAVVASGSRKELRVPLSSIQRKTVKAPVESAPKMQDVVFSSGESTGYANGQGMDWLDVGKAIDRKLQGYNGAQFENARAANRRIKEQHNIFSIRRDFGSDLTVSSSDRNHVDAVLAHAASEARLPGGSLVASGGWGAPSETVYDLMELESTEGLLSTPEVGVARGGITHTAGPSFAGIFSTITGFNFTEAEDKEGKYATGESGNVVGPKPSNMIEFPEFVDNRLEVGGLYLKAGLLGARGYPEAIARIVRGAVVAHEHRMDALKIAKMVAGSTAVSMTAGQIGTAAPVLSSIEMQVEHYRYTSRLPRGLTLEAVFPYWVRGAIRSDLSRRLGVDLLSVPDARIDGWFRERGINAQFVYNWQAVDVTAANEFKAWPSTVSFMLYAAGTWVRGAAPIITVDTLYDSTLLGTNDFTALFTEEGWLMAKRGHDSRVVSVPITATGATGMGLDLAHTGAQIVAP